MATLQLIRFLMDSAEELLVAVESGAPIIAGDMLDEAEELLALAANIMSRHKIDVGSSKEAA